MMVITHGSLAFPCIFFFSSFIKVLFVFLVVGVLISYILYYLGQSTNYKNIIPLNDKETRVPYKIMSFDIEASSSHGDFPVPIKSYKKLATNIADYFAKMNTDINIASCKTILSDIIRTAFNLTGDSKPVPNIDNVYYKGKALTRHELDLRIEEWLKTKIRDREDKNDDTHLIEAMFENANKAIQAKEKENEKEIFRCLKCARFEQYHEWKNRIGINQS